MPGDHQDKWRWCRKCRGLHYTGVTLGHCPDGGGPHSTEGSGSYFVPHSMPDRPLVQSNWRWCEHCQSLWWAGNPSQSRCPATGGQHSRNGSGNYVLNHK